MIVMMMPMTMTTVHDNNQHVQMEPPSLIIHIQNRKIIIQRNWGWALSSFHAKMTMITPTLWLYIFFKHHFKLGWMILIQILIQMLIQMLILRNSTTGCQKFQRVQVPTHDWSKTGARVRLHKFDLSCTVAALTVVTKVTTVALRWPRDEMQFSRRRQVLSPTFWHFGATFKRGLTWLGAFLFWFTQQ